MGLAKMPDVVNGYKWELYNLAEDYSENNDLAAKMPDKLRELQELFLVEAAKYNVFPLDNSVAPARPRAAAERHRRAGRVHLFGRDAPACPTRRRAEHPRPGRTPSPRRSRCPQGGGEGMIATMGGRFGGYGLYLLKGKPVFTLQLRWTWSASAGKARRRSRRASTRIVFDFTYDGPGFGKGGTGVLKVDGKEVATQNDPAHHSVPDDRSTRPSMSASTPARRWTTTTTRCRSASPARSPS